MKKTKLVTIFILVLLLCAGFIFGQDDDVSNKTIASVVRVGNIVNQYLVEGMPDDFVPTVEYGNVNFGGGRVLKKAQEIIYFGSGVIISEDGYVLSNAHVTDMTPTVMDLQDPNTGQIVIGNTGKPVKIVAVNEIREGFLLEVTTEEWLDTGVRKMELRYFATLVYQDPNYGDRDRALLKITHNVKLNAATEELVVTDLKPDQKFPSSQMGLPFVIRNPELVSIGYPGSMGSYVTLGYGRLLNYLNLDNGKNDRSHIHHRAFIDGGNSGGGLYLGDKLIGINTWSKPLPKSNMVFVAQPVTYFAEVFALLKLNGLKGLPEIPHEWIQKDPSTDPYKEKVFAGLDIRYMNNERIPVRGGIVLFSRPDIDLQTAQTILALNDLFSIWKLYRHYVDYEGYDHQTAADNIKANSGMFYFLFINDALLSNLSMVINYEDFLNFLSPDARKIVTTYLESETFSTDVVPINNEGKALLSVRPNADYNLFINDTRGWNEYTFSSTEEFMQGPFTVKINTY